jgi:hypothetical protein
VKRGQIAHLNHNPADNRADNLVYLCFEHHDEYDSTTRQAKGLTEGEVRHHRDRLHDAMRPKQEVMGRVEPSEDDAPETEVELTPFPRHPSYGIVRRANPRFSEMVSGPWKFYGNPTANEMEFFSYLASNGADGVCLIERINLPDGRVVIACVETAGNPGMSITNAVEELSFQVCERFDVPPDRLVWLENYHSDDEDEWDWVHFKERPPQRPFEDPTWIQMTDELWNTLYLRPEKRSRLKFTGFRCASKLRKLFPWP